MIIQSLLPRISPLVSGHSTVKVLMVCLGNICRSPAAEGMLNQVIADHHAQARWEVDSAGTGDYHIGQLADPRMRAHARRRDINLTHRCRQVRESDFSEFDLIIGMDASNLANLHRLAPSPEAEQRIFGMAEFFALATRYDHVPDPYYEGAEGFELVLDLLADATLNLYDTVTAAL